MDMKDVNKALNIAVNAVQSMKNEINKYRWTEITPDNVDKIRKNKGKIVVMNPKEWNDPEMLYSLPADTFVLYSEWGGYYYYVLPELKIE